MRKLFIGSTNLSKISDWKCYLSDSFEILSPKTQNLSLEVSEKESSLEENAILKATQWAHASNMVTLSDDSGFFIAELKNKPGVITKRWLKVNNLTNMNLITFIKNLNNKECYFKTVVAVATPTGNAFKYEYEVEGKLVIPKTRNIKTDEDYSLGRFFQHNLGDKTWSEMNKKERKYADSRLIKQTKILIEKAFSYQNIIAEIGEGPKKVKLGFPTTIPDQLAVDVFGFASSFQPNNCGLLTKRNDHKNPFKIHEAKSLHQIANFMGDKHADGYLNSGATESNLMAMWIAREKFKRDGYKENNIVVLKTKLTHYSISKAANILNLKNVKDVILDNNFSMDIDLLIRTVNIELKNNKVIIIMCTNGYNVTGSSDRFDKVDEFISNLSDDLKNKVYLHIDAATSGFISPFVNKKFRYLRYKSVKSLALDGHKLGLMPYPNGIFLARKGLFDYISNNVDYLGTQDQTFSGSRTGASASALWSVLNGLGLDFYRDNAELCIEYKNYLIKRLNDMQSEVDIIDSKESNIIGVSFIGLPNNRLENVVEGKYSLHPSLLSLRKSEEPRFYYQMVITPEIDFSVIDQFVSNIDKNDKN